MHPGACDVRAVRESPDCLLPPTATLGPAEPGNAPILPIRAQSSQWCLWFLGEQDSALAATR